MKTGIYKAQINNHDLLQLSNPPLCKMKDFKFLIVSSPSEGLSEHLLWALISFMSVFHDLFFPKPLFLINLELEFQCKNLGETYTFWSLRLIPSSYHFHFHPNRSPKSSINSEHFYRCILYRCCEPIHPQQIPNSIPRAGVPSIRPWQERVTFFLRSGGWGQERTVAKREYNERNCTEWCLFTKRAGKLWPLVQVQLAPWFCKGSFHWNTATPICLLTTMAELTGYTTEYNRNPITCKD